MSSSKLEMRDFYKGKTLFITGATGFIGKVLLIKIFDSLPDIDRVYVLVRSKKNVTFQDRLRNLLQSDVFAGVRNKCNLADRVEAIEGDINLPNLGLTKSDEEKLTAAVHIVFHNAATIKFTEPVRKAMKTNLIGTQQVIELSRKMKQLQSIVHCSTAYCNVHRDDPVIYERIYPAHMDVDDFIAMIDGMQDDELAQLEKEFSKRIFGHQFNSYSLTKHFAECWIEKHAYDLPISIVRPSIVPYCYKEPIPGYADSMFSANVYFSAVYAGYSSVMLTDGNMKADMITADYLVKFLLVAAKFNAVRSKSLALPRSLSGSPIFVYHFTANQSVNITNKEKLEFFMNKIDKYPLKQAVRKPQVRFATSKTKYTILFFFYDYLPTLIAQSVLKSYGFKKNLLDLQMQLYKTSLIARPFLLKIWNFTNNNRYFLNEQLSNEDKELFDFDDSKLDKNFAADSCVKGIRKFIFKENEDTLDDAKQKQVLLIIINFAVKLLFYMLIVKLVLFLFFSA